MEELLSWGNVLNDGTLRANYNTNLERIAKGFKATQEYQDYLEKRISSLILNTDHVELPNELIDIRTSKLLNKTFDTANLRVVEDVEQLSKVQASTLDKLTEIEEISETVKKRLDRLYGLDAGKIELYVNASLGNDISGDGSYQKPFKSINKTLSIIPRILNGNSIWVYVYPGTYNEAVVIPKFSGGRLYLRSTNFDTVNTVNATGCKVYSILAEDIPWLHIGGFEQLAEYTSYPEYFIRGNYCGWLDLRKIRFATNLRNQSVYALILHSSSAWLADSRWQNQNMDIRAQYSSMVTIEETCTHGGKSVLGLDVQFSSMYNRRDNKLNWEADTPIRKLGGGEVYTS